MVPFLLLTSEREGDKQDHKSMSRPVFTPTTGDRIADLILYLETAPVPDIRLTPLGLRQGRDVIAVVLTRTGDGQRDSLSADEARLMARALRDDGHEDSQPFAAGLDVAAAEADHAAAKVLAAFGVGRVFNQPHAFGAR